MPFESGIASNISFFRSPRGLNRHLTGETSPCFQCELGCQQHRRITHAHVWSPNELGEKDVVVRPQVASSSLRRAAFLCRYLSALCRSVMASRCPSIPLWAWGWFWIVVLVDLHVARGGSRPLGLGPVSLLIGPERFVRLMIDDGV